MTAIRFLLLLLPIVFCVPSAGRAFDRNEPRGFRGIEWWTHIGALPDMKQLDDKDAVRLYVREGDKLEIGEAKVEDIWYIFANDRLSKITVNYRAESNHQALKSLLFSTFGDGRDLTGEGWQYYWFGPRVRMTLEYDKDSKIGVFRLNAKGVFFYKPEDDGPQKVESAAPGL